MQGLLSRIKPIWFKFFLLVFIIITGLMAGHRAKKGSNDFDTFYAAGHAVIHGEGIYYSGEYYQDKGETSPFLYPPAAACFFALFAWLPIKISAFLWNAFNILLLLFLVPILLQLADTNQPTFKASWERVPRISKLVLAGFGIAAILDNLTMAQMNLWVFFLTLLSFLLLKKGKPVAAGMILSAAVMMKVTPLIFLPYFFLHRKWKVVIGFFAGAFLLTCVVPTLILGWNQNRLAHRQFAGRTIKPALIQVLQKFQTDEARHPLKKSFSDFADDRLDNCLTEKNQSLEAMITRLFLKHRNKYAEEPHVLSSVKRYHSLPVLFGGLSEARLLFAIRCIQGFLFAALLFLWIKKSAWDENTSLNLKMALGFATLTLLSPALRSQQYIVWIQIYFVIILLLSTPEPFSLKIAAYLRWLIPASCVLYFGQSFLYGSAAGCGTWANLLLWMTCAWCLLVPAQNLKSLNHA